MSTYTGQSAKSPVSGSHTMTYDEDQVTSPLCELSLGTIVEAQEGSNTSVSGESDTDSFISEPPEPPPLKDTKNNKNNKNNNNNNNATCLKRDATLELSEYQDKVVDKKHPDIDGGWAWVVLVCMFSIFAIISGLLYTTGLYYVQMLKEYEKSRSYTAWVGSLVNAFFMLGGPVSSVFIQRFGCRAALMSGSLLMAVGYVCSAFSNSLEMLFFTYGVVVGGRKREMLVLISALGMNFCYSGQIIALAQYFDKKQSVATSTSMMGIGIGMFFMSSLMEHIFETYGWRGAFLFSAGMSLQITVLGALVFPIHLSSEEDCSDSLQQQAKNVPGSVATINKGLPSSRSRGFFEKTPNDKSFSSLNMSVSASYLSHSLLSLSDPKANYRGNHDSGLRSNQHSFCSKSSHFGVRSNAYSFSHRGSHAGLSQYDLHPNQYSFHHRDSYHVDMGIRSNNQSFCSRKGSQAGMSGVISNPNSFCMKASQMELNQSPHPHDMEMEKLCGSDHGPTMPKKAAFLIREGDCDLSCCVEEPEDFEEPGTSTAGQEYAMYNDQKSKYSKLFEKMKLRTHVAIRTLAKKSTDHPLMDPRFWLMDFSVCFCMLGTLTLYIIYKDFADYMGVGQYYTYALSGIGIGDLIGRVGTGIFVSSKYVDAIFTYGVAQLLCCIVLVGHLFITNVAGLIGLTTAFGILYGSQNILIAMAPSEVFGREKLVVVFGHILFLGGIGALIGAPIAGTIVDYTGMYEGVIWFSVANLFAGTVLMFLCYLIHHKKKQQAKKATDEV